MEIDLKNGWKATKEVLGSIVPEAELKNLNRATALDRLAKRYWRFAIFATVVILCFLLINRDETMPENLRILFGYVFPVIIGISGITDYILAHKIRQINPATMPVEEVIRRSMQCRRIHLWFVAIALPVVVVVTLIIATKLAGVDRGMAISMGIGGAVGVAIGLKLLCRFMADYRSLTDK